MAKGRVRSTCTECSLRRQQCDRRSPCGRGVKRGIPDKCQLNWQGGRYDPAKHRAYPSRQRQLRPTPPSDRADQSPDYGLLPGLAGDPTSLQTEEVWDSFRANAPRPQYAFTPYEHARLRKSTPQVAGGGNPSFFSSTGSGSGSGQGPHPTAAAHEAFLQLLLPSLDHIWKLVDYHEVYLLWYHCCYHGPTFRSELESVIAEQEDQTTLNVGGLHLRWLALLFSIMAGSLTCTSERRLREWGFSKSEAVKLSLQWYKAAITCLNHGEWMSDHDIYSVQAVTTLTMSAHPLGRSTELSVLLGAALKIAQALGLDKLGYNAVLETIDETSSKEQRHRSIRRELGRKLWSQLCVQDWMSLPSAGSHNINPSHFTTTRPSSRDHLTMDPLPATFPTYISYGNYLFEIAKLVVQHHEAVLQSTTPFTKYQHTLDYDTQMRDLATKAAAKTILNEAKQARDVDGPIIWIDKAFCVAAAIILCLDIFHRPESDPELATHRGLVLECIEQLRKFESSVIAVRGANLLTEILAERDHASFSLGWPPQSIDTLQIANSISALDDTLSLPGLDSLSTAELFPPQTGFSNAFLFEHLLGQNTSEG